MPRGSVKISAAGGRGCKVPVVTRDQRRRGNHEESGNGRQRRKAEYRSKKTREPGGGAEQGNTSNGCPQAFDVLPVYHFGFSMPSQKNKDAGRLIAKRHEVENIVAAGAFRQKETTLTPYRNQRCWVKKDGNFDTMHRFPEQSCKSAPVGAPGKPACACFLLAVFRSFFKCAFSEPAISCSNRFSLIDYRY